MQKVFDDQKERQASTDSAETSHDTDDVYYRFGGAAIATMLHLRYDSLKGVSDPVKKASLKGEIDLLRHLQCTDKNISSIGTEVTCISQRNVSFLSLKPLTSVCVNMQMKTH